MSDSPPANQDLTVKYEAYGRSGGAVITLSLPGGETFTHRAIITDAGKRRELLEAAAQRFPGVDPDTLAAELERIAAEILDTMTGPRGSSPPSQATTLVSLVEASGGAELFHTPGADDSEAFVSAVVNGHRETWAINSRAFKRWLAHQFYLREQSAPNSQALADAINVLAGRAIHVGAEHQVHVRIAEHEGEIWLDLGDPQWRAVRITVSGWTVVDSDVPVRFIRKRGMQAIPAPVRGGSLQLLRPVVNLPDDDQWILVVAWLVAALRPGRPFTLLNVNGEQGSAKSTLCKMLRSLIDPAIPLLRRPPRDDRDLMIAATNCGIVAFDNISNLNPSLSDSLCSLATGGGFATRELYTDGDEKLFDATRPVILNGIDDSVVRADLLDRAVNVMLPTIADSERRAEEELWREFDRNRPRVLGAILTAVSTGLRRLPSTRLSDMPRMADFALFVNAAEPSLPWTEGEFMRAYQANRDNAVGIAVEASPIAMAVIKLLEDKKSWQGTAGNLLTLLNQRSKADGLTFPKDWPANRKAMGNDLRRIAPALRSVGVSVHLPDRPTGRKKERIIRVVLSPGARSAPSASSANARSAVRNGLQPTLGADHVPAAADHPAPSRSATGTPSDTDSESAVPIADRADHADHADHPPGGCLGGDGNIPDCDEEEFV